LYAITERENTAIDVARKRLKGKNSVVIALAAILWPSFSRAFSCRAATAAHIAAPLPPVFPSLLLSAASVW
jgi:hypothetical protein